jgi:hypothetical protein
MRTDDKPIRLDRYDTIGSLIETSIIVEAAGKVTIKENTGAIATLRLENNGGKGGEIIASETGGFLAVQAQAGYNLTLESTNGNVNIATGLPDTTLTASVNGGSAGLTLADTAGTGTVDVAAGDYIKLDAASTNSLTVGASTVDVNIGVGVSGSVVKFGTGSITIESDFGVGAPVLSLIDTSTGNGGSIEFGINSLSIGTNTGDVSIYAPMGIASITAPTISLVAPIVTLDTIPSATKTNILYFDTSTKAVSYGSPFPAITVQAATGTIALTEAMNRSTYILTGTSATQTFSVAGLAGVAAGWTVYLRNGNNATGVTRDITITIPAGNTTLHAPTGTTNSSYILLYWTGSALVAYR